MSAETKRTKTVSERLNSNCFCISLDNDVLRMALSSELGSPDLMKLVEERCPHLFSAQPVFVSETEKMRMAKVVQAVESVIGLPSYREHILAQAPTVARHDPGGAKGVFFGYDFHLREGSLGLIEINTNAGGAMLNAVMARAHQACCMDDEKLAAATASAAAFEKSIVDMFLSDWKLANRGRPLHTIAIVDSAPQEQYLYPEFLLFQKLFERHDLHAVIAAPSELRLHEGVLWHGDLAIDLVYNRLTDFMLESPECATLRAAYLERAVVLTPHPQAHALYADKRNLAVLSNAKQLEALGVPHDIQEVLLSSILPTEVVDITHADRLWNERRHLFFKPASGYGSRAAYRGDKITKRVWQDILEGDYVAQAVMLPGERVIGTQESPQSLKFDIRCYTYAGDVQWTAARMYQGQTTNFRTPGGGFAPVYSLPDVDFIQEISAIPRETGDAAACCGNDCT